MKYLLYVFIFSQLNCQILKQIFDDFKSNDIIKSFIQFKNEYKKKYSSPEEEEYRKGIFNENLKQLEDLKKNSKEENIEFGVTIFYDLTDDEFSKTHHLDKKFFNQKEYKPSSKIFEPESFISQQLYYKDSKWLPKFINDLFNDKKFDFFRAVLVEEEQMKNLEQDKTFFDFQNKDVFQEYTMFDVNKEIKDIMVHFSEHYKKMKDKLQQQIKEKHGRRLQFFYDPYLDYSFYTPNVPLISQVNNKYFNDRAYDREHPNIKNPFDARSNGFRNYNGFNWRRSNDFTSDISTRAHDDFIYIDGVQIPAQVNWNATGNFTPVKDQLDCNTCYAFGAISGIEAHQVLFKNNRSTYSEQEILDCSVRNNGCEGGQPFMVFDYMQQYGIHYDSNYYYNARKKQCQANQYQQFKAYNLLKGYVFVKQGIKNLILSAALGPIVVVSYASQIFKSYRRGIYAGQGCNTLRDPNHTSLLYGYNFNTAVPYMLFKNNWGTQWGEYGYYKVAIGSLTDSNYGYCLIANTPYNVMPIVQSIQINYFKIKNKSIIFIRQIYALDIKKEHSFSCCYI